MTVIALLPNTGHAPNNAAVAAHLREQADWVEQGLQGNVDTVLVITETSDGGLIMHVAGKPNDAARIAGLLHMAGIRHAIGEL